MQAAAAFLNVRLRHPRLRGLNDHRQPIVQGLCDVPTPLSRPAYEKVVTRAHEYLQSQSKPEASFYVNHAGSHAQIDPGKRRSMKMGSHRGSVGPMAASAAPQTRRCGKRLGLRVDGRTLGKWPVLAAPARTWAPWTHQTGPPGWQRRTLQTLPESGMHRQSTQQPTKYRAIARLSESKSPIQMSGYEHSS